MPSMLDGAQVWMVAVLAVAGRASLATCKKKEPSADKVLVRAALPLMLGTIVLVGCSLIALDDYSGGTPVSPDGSAPDAPTASTDAEADSSADAASADGDAMPAPPFCASLSPQPTVCLDFDGAPAFGSWIPTGKNGGKVEASSAAFTSAPRAGSFSHTPGSGAGVMVLRYALATAGVPDEMTLTADVRIEAVSPDDELDIMTVVFPVGTGNDSLELQFSTSDGLYELQTWSFLGDGGGGGSSSSFKRPITVGKWQHLRLFLQLKARRATLEIDGVAAPEIALTLPSGLGAPSLELGDGYLPGGASAFYMDNFTATVK